MASVGTYGTRTLNSNWYEDRHQPAGSLSATTNYAKRFARAYETDIAYIGERFDVCSRMSRMPERKSYATPDDGFRVSERLSSVDFAHPLSRTEWIKKPPAKPRILSSESVPELSFEDRRPVPGPPRGFGSVVDRHHHTEGERFWDTSHSEAYGEHARNPPPRREPHKHMPRPGGVTSEADEARQQGMKCGVLCGENFNETEDPANNTKVQRSWMYSSDPAIGNVHFGGTHNRPKLAKNDSSLSVNLGAGAMAKVREALKARNGNLGRASTHITTGNSKRWGTNKFEDG